jgi:hypothetical protein
MDSPSVPEGLRLAHEQAQLSCDLLNDRVSLGTP